jgi:predicted secreted Zn-dependent protease
MIASFANLLLISALLIGLAVLIVKAIGPAVKRMHEEEARIRRHEAWLAEQSRHEESLREQARLEIERELGSIEQSLGAPPNRESEGPKP